MPMFEVGEKIYARWPHTKTWYPGKISHKVDSLTVDVVFEDGTTLDELPLSYIKSERSLRSRSRGRSRSRSRSRGRSKSPARTKSKQSPSPSRKSRSTTKQVTKTPTTPTRQSARIKDIIVKQESLKEEKTTTTVTEKNDRGEGSTKVETKTDTKAEVSSSEYGLGGPIGAFFLTVGMPLLLLGVNLGCDKKSCSLTKLPSLPRKLSSYFDWDTTMLFFGFLVFQLVASVLPVGKVVKGFKSSSGSKPLDYRCNGFLSVLSSYSTLAALIYLGYPVTIVYKKIFKLSVLATVFALVLSLFAFFKSRSLPAKERAASGNTGYPTYDFFMGRELNPRIGPLDLKMFVLTFGLTGWQTVNTVLAYKAYADGSLNAALAAVVLFQNLYIADFLFFESSMLGTLYVNYDGLGFMKVFGGLAMLPLFHSLQARYLLEHTVSWHPGFITGFIILFLVGYLVSRGSNSEKDRFRTDPHNPVFANFNKIPSPSGKKLLASGWWGLCRHPNYLGSIIMAIAWTLPCGCSSAVPFIFPVLLTTHLLMRARADDRLCRKKHGAAWERYCRDVKYVLVPRVY